jgi:hypothetical protein
MPVYIMYFNLKDDASEDEFVKKLKVYLDYIQDRVEGLGPSKLYKHHAFGANPRTFQMHTEFDNFSTWDRYLAVMGEDAKFARLSQEWHNLIDLKTHFDEFISEIPV